MRNALAACALLASPAFSAAPVVKALDMQIHRAIPRLAGGYRSPAEIDRPAPTSAHELQAASLVKSALSGGPEGSLAELGRALESDPSPEARRAQRGLEQIRRLLVGSAAAPEAAAELAEGADPEKARAALAALFENARADAGAPAADPGLDRFMRLSAAVRERPDLLGLGHMEIDRIAQGLAKSGIDFDFRTGRFTRRSSLDRLLGRAERPVPESRLESMLDRYLSAIEKTRAQMALLYYGAD